MSQTGFLPPTDYVTPSWPSLYWPVTDPLGHGIFMYYPRDIWLFTTYWTLLFIMSIYTVAGIWAAIVFARRRYKWALILPLVFMVIGAGIAFVSGSLVGFAIAAIYNAGFYRMSTWVPFLWGLIQALVVIMGSYSTVTTIL
ncbi:hypothetical protein DFQ27_004179 [Actinomortierella ambigua]|uniref:Integral membrane protein n=1 Tax=Actinomortierella ambigua TaxID=1343610 RepID=A0A9P6Q4L3_9FUNG|nr:hypothetical protein DFQ27_004179 [Actinomortierella ambigua]